MINQLQAIVFPGQGSQSIGMLTDIAAHYPLVQQTYGIASSVLGYDLWEMVSNGSETDLNNTVHTQPALLAGAYAIWKILREHSDQIPKFLAGHSLGEYTALVCAESITFADGIKLVAARGQYMQEAVAVGVGAMGAIIGLEDANVFDICKEIASLNNEIISPANLNSIGQVVIAGHKSSVEQALKIAKQRGAKLTTLIPVSVPSHCELMHPAAKNLAALLTTIEIKSPVIPVINNADVDIYKSAEQIRDGLTKQLYSPVRWVETIQYLMRHGISEIIECGPGKILSGLNKRIDKNLKLLTSSDLASLQLLLNLNADLLNADH